ncbi:MAG: bifunctional serine/threonine-protein kinase/formylglycine-generating enzyme family protein [Chloroflexota bacterium]
MPNLTGQSIGRYHIIVPLGEGGMATVYKAFDTRLECDVAIKFIRKENVPASQWERMNARFEREAKRMAKLMHPNIVKVTDYGEYEGNPYLVMPYLPGGTLKNRSQKFMSYQQAVCLLAPVARALEYAHRQNTIHRDVKPANILITEDGAPMLADFGVAKILDLDEGNTLTGTGMGVGTPKYMAPEQWLNRVSPQTDVYALGVVFYELLTGRVPYDADTPAGVMLKQSNEPLPRPKQFVPGITEDVERVIFKALAKDPQQRYADMEALAQALERLATLAPVSQEIKRNETTIDYGDAAQPSSSAKSPQSEKSAVQTSLLLGIGGLGLLFLIVIIGGASWLLNRPIKPSNVVNAETVQASSQQTLTVMGEQSPTVSNDGKNRVSAKDGMEMIYIPPGEFLMGSTDNDSDARYDEQPQHKVYLDAYWMDKTEVTNAMYKKCVADGSCQEPNDKKSNTQNDYYGNDQYANYPVIYVDWNQAQEYCKWAGGSLPTEAQWEKAARGEDGRKYSWGNETASCKLANYSVCAGDTKAVGSLADGASPYGVMDMSGNVWEWVNDWYGDNYYQTSPQKNPTGPDSGTVRVLRGGSWAYDSWYLRSAYRNWDNPGNCYNDYGFRCAGF